MRVETAAYAGPLLRNEAPAAQATDNRRNVSEVAVNQPGTKQNTTASEQVQSKLKELTQDGTFSIRFEKNTDSGTMVIKVVDQATGEVLRQIPPEEFLDMSKRLSDFRGLIVNTES